MPLDLFSQRCCRVRPRRRQPRDTAQALRDVQQGHDADGRAPGEDGPLEEGRRQENDRRGLRCKWRSGWSDLILILRF